MCSGLAKYDRNKQFYVVCLRLLAFMKLESDIGYKKNLVHARKSGASQLNSWTHSPKSFNLFEQPPLF